MRKRIHCTCTSAKLGSPVPWPLAALVALGASSAPQFSADSRHIRPFTTRISEDRFTSRTAVHNSNMSQPQHISVCTTSASGQSNASADLSPTSSHVWPPLRPSVTMPSFATIRAPQVHRPPPPTLAHIVDELSEYSAKVAWVEAGGDGRGTPSQESPSTDDDDRADAVTTLWLTPPTSFNLDAMDFQLSDPGRSTSGWVFAMDAQEPRVTGQLESPANEAAGRQYQGWSAPLLTDPLSLSLGDAVPSPLQWFELVQSARDVVRVLPAPPMQWSMEPQRTSRQRSDALPPNIFGRQQRTANWVQAVRPSPNMSVADQTVVVVSMDTENGYAVIQRYDAARIRGRLCQGIMRAWVERPWLILITFGTGLLLAGGWLVHVFM